MKEVLAVAEIDLKRKRREEVQRRSQGSGMSVEVPEVVEGDEWSVRMVEVPLKEKILEWLENTE